jgi:glycerophosphoryl diester phosphodiesterase
MQMARSKSTEKLPEIIAHKGFHRDCLPNSIDACIEACRIGADWIEVDIRRTVDNMIIVYHDPDFDGIPVNNLSFERLSRTAGERGLTIPTLTEIMDIVSGNIRLLIDLKEAGYEKELCELLLGKLQLEEFIIVSLLENSLDVIKKNFPHIKTGITLGSTKSKTPLRKLIEDIFPFKRAARVDAQSIIPNRIFLLVNIHKRSRKKGYRVIVWTVNRKSTLRKLIAGRLVDGIITDNPDVALDIRNRIKD